MAYSGWGKRKRNGCSAIIFWILVVFFTISFISLTFYVLIIGIAIYMIYLIIKLIFNQIRCKKQKKVKRPRTSMVKCQLCGSFMPDYFTYCSNCGEKLFINCHNCGCRNRSIYTYCVNCGHKLNEFYMTKYQIECYARMCNTYLDHQDKIDRYKDIDN